MTALKTSNDRKIAIKVKIKSNSNYTFILIICNLTTIPRLSKTILYTSKHHQEENYCPVALVGMIRLSLNVFQWYDGLTEVKRNQGEMKQ